LSQAQGRVLEIGIGSGLNLPLYGPRVDAILGLDPAARLIAMAQDAANRSKIPVTLINASAQAIPIDRGSIDTLVTTWTLCSIPDAGAAQRNAARAQTRRPVIVRRTRERTRGKSA
jgi:ubiquinone/menaquinone biosynthesis C-methylase UbiE